LFGDQTIPQWQKQLGLPVAIAAANLKWKN
jgi:hypothetical protein